MNLVEDAAGPGREGPVVNAGRPAGISGREALLPALALLVVADSENSYLISGSGDLIEPDDGILSVGSGGAYALAAARALLHYSSLDAKTICEQSMKIAADICIYTNSTILVEEL